MPIVNIKCPTVNSTKDEMVAGNTQDAETTAMTFFIGANVSWMMTEPSKSFRTLINHMVRNSKVSGFPFIEGAGAEDYYIVKVPRTDMSITPDEIEYATGDAADIDADAWGIIVGKDFFPNDPVVQGTSEIFFGIAKKVNEKLTEVLKVGAPS